MCMSKVYTTKRHNGRVSKTNEGYMTGWKKFKNLGTDGRPELFNIIKGGDKRIPLNKWMDASDELISSGSAWNKGPDYTSGFHIFLNKEDAEKFGVKNSNRALREVAFDEVVAIGDNGGLCVIAKKMKVLPLKKAK